MKNNSFYILLIPILLIFVSDNVHAENYHGHRTISDETGDAYTLYFSEHDNDKFEITEIPEKWKNESAVIICQEHVFSYLREKCYSYISESFRRRVKLQDKAAVELFSELYFIKSDDIYNIRINIYKPDGSVIDVSIDDAVEVTQEVPRIFRYGNIKTYQYNKLAVPNLEIGDILDYEISEKNADVNGSIYSLVSSYPIMNQSYVFTLDIGFLLKFNSYNGAPSLEYNSNGKDCYNRERAIVKTYRIDDYDREKIPDINWLNIYRSYPYIKFTIYSPRVYKHLDFYVTNHEKRISVDEDINFDLLRRNYCAGLNVYGNLSYCIHEPSLLRMARKDELLCDSEIEKLELLNEMFRFFYFYHNEYTNDIHYGDVEPNKFIYVWTFRSLLKYYKIDSEFVICIDKDMGSVKNVVYAYELYFGLKLNLDKEIYIFPFDLYSDFGDIPIELQGSEALIYEKIYADSI
ncbi:MAG: hypothetical protein C0596_11475 [Marinilabiliales bacterium]|nr:MAG: hypothetical protein C0596_11475 [Marinilabiliales bacterium]